MKKKNINAIPNDTIVTILMKQDVTIEKAKEISKTAEDKGWFVRVINPNDFKQIFTD